MRKLKTGDLVYSKYAGIGIVINERLTSGNPGIRFEGENMSSDVPREKLFAKGDKVLVQYNRTSSDKGDCFDMSDERDFIAYTPFTKKNKFVVTNSYYKTKNAGYTHVYDIKHVEEDVIEITVKVNGREVPLDTISRATLLRIRNGVKEYDNQRTK